MKRIGILSRPSTAIGLLKWAGVVAVLVQGAVAVSDEPPKVEEPISTVHRHFGFFLRFDTGPAYTFANEGSRDLKGGGWDFGSSIGGALCENNILAFHSWSVLALNSASSTSSTTSSSVFQLYGIGPEYTHYFMPSNFYLSGSVLLTFAALTNSVTTSGSGVSTNQSTTYSTDPGIGLNLAIGKEWWVSDHWGLGIALQYKGSWNHDSGGILGSSTLATNAFSVDFSATYN